MTLVNLPGPVYTENDAFCKKIDVEGLCARGSFTNNTVPTGQQALDWMARIAADIESILALNGITYTVSTHGAPFPASPTDAKTARLKKLAESANAIGAAAQLMAAHSIKNEYGQVPGAMSLFKQYEGLLDTITAVADGSASVAVFSDTNTEKLTFLTTTEF